MVKRQAQINAEVKERRCICDRGRIGYSDPNCPVHGQSMTEIARDMTDSEKEKTMTETELAVFMRTWFDEKIMRLKEEGGKEYSAEKNAFHNFEEEGEELKISPAKILWIHAMKHKRGIAAHLRGHISQREPVEGRISDLIVYLFILLAMILDKRKPDGIYTKEVTAEETAGDSVTV